MILLPVSIGTSSPSAWAPYLYLTSGNCATVGSQVLIGTRPVGLGDGSSRTSQRLPNVVSVKPQLKSLRSVNALRPIKPSRRTTTARHRRRRSNLASLLHLCRTLLQIRDFNLQVSRSRRRLGSEGRVAIGVCCDRMREDIGEARQYASYISLVSRRGEVCSLHRILAFLRA